MNSLLDKVRLIEFKPLGDNRGFLTVIEGNIDIPFDIARIFYIYGTSSDVVRGSHANKHSEFVLININGTSKIKVTDGFSEKIYTLDKPHVGIYIPKMVWKDMYNFSADSILLCIASEHYDSSEYIRDFEQYKKESIKFYE